MRLKEDMINYVSTMIVDDLLKNGLIEIDCAKEKIVDSIGKIIIDELMQEDKLNDEVKELLKVDDEIDEAARKTLASYSKNIREGTPEWEVLYNKHYNEEAKKRRGF